MIANQPFSQMVPDQVYRAMGIALAAYGAYAFIRILWGLVLEDVWWWLRCLPRRIRCRLVLMYYGNRSRLRFLIRKATEPGIRKFNRELQKALRSGRSHERS